MEHDRFILGNQDSSSLHAVRSGFPQCAAESLVDHVGTEGVVEALISLKRLKSCLYEHTSRSFLDCRLEACVEGQRDNDPFSLITDRPSQGIKYGHNPGKD